MLLILREEIVCTIILIFLIFYYIVNKVKDKEMLFLKVSCSAVIYVIFDILTVITVNNRDTVPDPVNRVLHICFYITGLLFAMLFYHYIIQNSAWFMEASRSPSTLLPKNRRGANPVFPKNAELSAFFMF